MNIRDLDLEFIRALVLERSGIVLNDSKRYLVESRLGSLARKLDFASIDDLVRTARSGDDAKLRISLVEAMTTNETSFLRDFHPFELLRSQILPELMERRAEARELNLWCAAASSGQEPYTIAMLLREHFPELADWKLTFLATDLSEEMLSRAREGIYSQLEINRGLPAAFLVKYFEQHERSWQVLPEIREMIEFRRLNLIGAWRRMPPMDVVFLRNVLIYFDLDTKREVIRRVRESMSSDGYLFLGAAETTIDLDDEIERVQGESSSYYRPRRR